MRTRKPSRSGGKTSSTVMMRSFSFGTRKATFRYRHSMPSEIESRCQRFNTFRNAERIQKVHIFSMVEQFSEKKGVRMASRTSGLRDSRCQVRAPALASGFSTTFSDFFPPLFFPVSDKTHFFGKYGFGLAIASATVPSPLPIPMKSAMFGLPTVTGLG